MATIKVKAYRPGAKPDSCLGYYADERRYQGDEFEISDRPKVKTVEGGGPNGDDIEVPVAGTLAEFSDNKRKKNPGWMRFVDPADDLKYRKGGFNASVATAPAAAAPSGATPSEQKPAEGGKPGKPKASGDKSVLE